MTYASGQLNIKKNLGLSEFLGTNDEGKYRMHQITYKMKQITLVSRE